MSEAIKMKVEAYLDGSLSGEERVAFEQELQNDSALQKELDLQRDMIAMLKTSEDLALKKDISQMWEEVKASPKEEGNIRDLKPKRHWSYFAIRIAAVGLFLIASWWALTTFQSTQTPVQMADQLLEQKYKAPIYSKSTSDGLDKDWKEAIEFYQQQKYEQAVSSIEEISTKGKATIEQQFYLGLSYLFQEEVAYDKVILHLRNVVKDGHPLYKEQALWFISLAYLKKGDTEMGKRYLQEIVKFRLWKKEEAKSLLKKL